MLLIQSAYGAFEGFFAYSEAFFDFVGRAAVGKWQGASGSAEFVEKYFGEVSETRLADALELEVEFAVGTHGDNCGREYVAGMGLGFENLVVVNHSGAAVVGYDFKTEGRFLLDDDFYFLTAMIM